MFFPRLRRQAKWAFAFMVLVFGLGFVLLGVGSGSSGIGDLLQGRFGDLFGGSSGPSISKAQDRVKKNPKDASAYRDLATALESKQRTVGAVVALKKYVALRPKDSSVLQELASLQLTRAEGVASRAAVAYQQAQAASFGQSLGPSPTSKLGQALGTDPITQAVSSEAITRYQTLSSSAQSAYGDAVATYKKLAKLQPDVATTQEELALAADQAGDTKTALAAYSRYLKLAPDANDAAQVKQRIAQLRATTTLSPTGGGG